MESGRGGWHNSICFSSWKPKWRYQPVWSHGYGEGFLPPAWVDLSGCRSSVLPHIVSALLELIFMIMAFSVSSHWQKRHEAVLIGEVHTAEAFDFIQLYLRCLGEDNILEACLTYPDLIAVRPSKVVLRVSGMMLIHGRGIFHLYKSVVANIVQIASWLLSEVFQSVQSP